jgi:NAD(P)H-flavin reductase
MPIKKIKGKISRVTDLTSTSREIELTLTEELDFLPGAFVNIFIDIEGEKLRRAYSISSFESPSKRINLSVRKTPKGRVSPIFWGNNIIKKEIEIMGPLGLNTADKIINKKVYLFSFGIGVSVIKSIAKYLIDQIKIEDLTIYMGQRNEKEIIYKDFFDSISDRTKIKYILSQPTDSNYLNHGYIQDHIEKLDFDNSSVYICGQDKACQSLKERILDSNPKNIQFLIEGFH